MESCIFLNKSQTMKAECFYPFIKIGYKKILNADKVVFFYFTDYMVYFSIHIVSNVSCWYFEKKK